MKNIITTVLCMTIAVCNTLNAQETMKEDKAFSVADMSSFKSHNSNPWGLVYADALIENKAGAVNIHPITYELDGLKISANVYTPASYDEAKSYPALVVAHDFIVSAWRRRVTSASLLMPLIRERARASRAIRISLPIASRTFTVPQTSWRNIRVWTQGVSASSAFVAEAVIR